jgi:hypothetical protein
MNLVTNEKSKKAIRRWLTPTKSDWVNIQNPPDGKLPEPLGEILINLTERLHDATS